MKINHDNYESILIDYFDGALSDAERMDVELFLQQNPEIAEQFSDFTSVILSPNDNIVFDKKEELLIVTLPNQEFEQWENMQPKLSKEHISYPHKHKLLKLGKRQIPQWTWYAAAACLAIAVLLVRPVFEQDILDTTLIAAVTEELKIENIEAGKFPPKDAVYDAQGTVSPAGGGLRGWDFLADSAYPPPYPPPAGEMLPHTSCPVSSTLYSAPLLAIATIQPITNIQISREETIIESWQILRRVYPEHGQGIWYDDNEIWHDNMQIIRRERLELAVNNFVIDPAKSVIHNIARRFFERRTDVELFLEEQEFPQFFARRQ
ncbi:MAG: hypothetical protein FWD02_03845 [Bacteroidales bacterium]|nr:hypothetical protein [Bacteroidales bacterium]